MKQETKLPLFLQLFSDGGQEPPTPPTPDDENTPTPEPPNFTAEDMAKAVSDAITKYKQELENEKRVEEGKFKELYEQQQAELQRIKLEQVTTSKLIAKGYNGEQLEKIKALVKGSSEEEITSSIEQLAELIPSNPTDYVNPQGGQGKKPAGKQVDLKEEGAEWARSFLKTFKK